MIISFIYYVTLSKVVNSSFPECNIHTGVQGGCLAFTPLDGYLKLCELPFTWQRDLEIVRTMPPWCPSPNVPNLFPNEDEWIIRVYPRCHFWSFQSILIHSNSVLLIRVGLADEYESFEHVKKVHVVSTNKFDSCLTHWQRVAIVFVAQLTYCILVIGTIFLLYSGCSYCTLGHSYM